MGLGVAWAFRPFPSMLTILVSETQSAEADENILELAAAAAIYIPLPFLNSHLPCCPTLHHGYFRKSRDCKKTRPCTLNIVTFNCRSRCIVHVILCFGHILFEYILYLFFVYRHQGSKHLILLPIKKVSNWEGRRTFSLEHTLSKCK